MPAHLGGCPAGSEGYRSLLELARTPTADECAPQSGKWAVRDWAGDGAPKRPLDTASRLTASRLPYPFTHRRGGRGAGGCWLVLAVN